MTAARKTKPSRNPTPVAPTKPKLEVVTDATPSPKTKAKNPRRKHRAKRRKKNMSTGAKIAIAAGVVLVGVPLVLFAIGAVAVTKAVNTMPTLTPTPIVPTPTFVPTTTFVTTPTFVGPVGMRGH